MAPRIQDVRIEQRRLNQAEADLLITVLVEGAGPATEVRGRWVGPHCEGRDTVEVAYPLQPVAAAAPEQGHCFRVMIPDPAMWSPASPFLYRVTIELWEATERLERRVSEHGLRMPSAS